MRPAARARLLPKPTLSRTVPIPAILAGLLVAVTPLSAQRADFLFGRPVATVSFMTGWSMPGESGDLFAFSRKELTLSRGDFATPPFVMEAAVLTGSRLDVTVGFEYASSVVPSEMRDWVTQDDRPIPQSTEFKRYRFTGGLKLYLLPRGRSISEYVWIPTSWAPYVGGGMGVTWYRFVQHGDFVDYQTLDIFSERYTSNGRGTTPYASAGIDVSIAPYAMVVAEGRYYWGTGSVDQAVFQGFGDIDLSGFRAALGIALRLPKRSI